MAETPEGYVDDADYLTDMMALLALRLRREVAMVRALRRPERKDAFLGLFLSDEDAEVLLDQEGLATVELDIVGVFEECFELAEEGVRIARPNRR